MKRLAAFVAVIALGILGLDLLADATQNRPDVTTPDSTSEITVEVRTKGGYDPFLAAQGLWATCQQTVDDVRMVEPVAPTADGTYRVVVRPALGEHARRRLVGCLEDSTIDRVWGNVTSITP